jgi:hypothetical protein
MYYSSGYDGRSSSIGYELPPEGKVDGSLIAVMVRHEALHALFQGTDMADKSDREVGFSESTPVPRAELEALCNSLRQKTVDIRIAKSGQTIAKILERGEYHPEVKPLVDVVAEAFRNGTYADLLPKEGDDMGLYPLNNPACFQDSPSRTVVRQFGEDERLRDLAFGNEGWRDGGFHDVMNAADEAWMEADSILDKDGNPQVTIMTVLRESLYLREKGLSQADVMGHPYDNANELGTSIINIAISFPDEFEANLEKLPEGEKALIKRALELSIDVLVNKYSGKPELVHVLSQLGERLLP